MDGVQAQADDTRAGDFSAKLEKGKPWGFIGILDSSLGQGTFVQNSYARNALFTQGITVLPYYIFDVSDHKLKLQLRWDLAWEYTMSDQPSGRSVEPYNVVLSLSDRSVYDFGGLKISAGLSLTLPTSYGAIASTMIMSPGVNVGARYSLAGFLLSYRFSTTGYLSSTAVPAVPSSQLTRLRSGESAALGTPSKALRFINAFTVSYTPTEWAKDIPVVEDMSAFVNLMVINDLKYAVTDEVDQFTSPFATPGMGRNDLFWTTIGVAYDIVDNLSVELGLTALHNAQHDNGDFIFPLFGAMGSLSADNLSSWYLDFTYLY